MRFKGEGGGGGEIEKRKSKAEEEEKRRRESENFGGFGVRFRWAKGAFGNSSFSVLAANNMIHN